MFERNTVDNTRQQNAVAVEITLADDRTLAGKFALPMSKTLFDSLNGDGAFVEFEPYGSEREYIAKSALRSVRLIKVPRQKALQPPLADRDGFDPHTVLGIAKGASEAELRQAYHKLSLAYHPDRYAMAELPGEVKDYLETMARRVNAAYDLLRDEAVRTKKIAEKRTAPVYETRRAG